MKFISIYFKLLLCRFFLYRPVRKVFEYPEIYKYQATFVALNVFTTALSILLLFTWAPAWSRHLIRCGACCCLLFIAVCLDQFAWPMPAGIAALEVFPSSAPFHSFSTVCSDWSVAVDQFSHYIIKIHRFIWGWLCYSLLFLWQQLILGLIQAAAHQQIRLSFLIRWSFLRGDVYVMLLDAVSGVSALELSEIKVFRDVP